MSSDDIIILKGLAVYEKDTYTLSKNPEEDSDWLKLKKLYIFLSDVHKYFTKLHFHYPAGVKKLLCFDFRCC